jgi:hypothetical protein
LAGELVVAGAVVWIIDPGHGVVRRVDLRLGTEDKWEADVRELLPLIGKYSSDIGFE